jgi:thiol:disulfide interchange protein DsbD
MNRLPHLLLLLCTALWLSAAPPAVALPGEPAPDASDASSLFPVTTGAGGLSAVTADSAAPDINAPTDDFLPAAEAFSVQAGSRGHELHYTFRSADGYFLYRERFGFTPTDSAVQLGEPVFSKKGTPKSDPTFGQVEAFFGEVTVIVPVLSAPESFIEVTARYQGCADKGLCYLPLTHTDMFQVSPPPAEGPSLQAAGAASYANPNPAGTGTASGIARLLEDASWGQIALLFFGLGLALSFTPCVLPMVPILTSLIVGEGKGGGARRGFILSSSYVAGMSGTYTLAGVAAGATGASLQYWLQDPAVVSATAILFVILSLSMFGFYELQLPAFLRDRLHLAQSRQRGGRVAGALFMGALSALVVSPCVSAPLMGALLYIGNTGDPWLGGFALFMLSLGMGAPLIAVGTTEANVLPKAGAWMDNIKGLFGVMLLGVALWITRHLLPDPAVPVAAGVLAILAGLYLGAFDTLSHARGKFFRGLGLSALAAGAGLILAGSLQWSGLSLPGSTAAQEGLPFRRVDSLGALDQALADASNAGQPAMVDVWAEWCIACKEMERDVLSRADVRAGLEGFQLIKFDLTDSRDGAALLERYQLPGPPGYLFFARAGAELKGFRLAGSMQAEAFLQHLQSLPLDAR